MHLVGVQHHHAHIASCMAENHLDARVVGIALDGTGYGTDGRIWGGEVLIATYEDFERVAHFEYVPLPGGAAAIREPWRMALSFLWQHFGRECLQLPVPFVGDLDRKKAELVLRMIEQNINSPLTSSCGRLFDAVAALIGIRQQVNYEAQAAVELEMAITEDADDAYPLAVAPAHGGWVISTKPLFEAVVTDIRAHVLPGVISRRFHNGLVEVLARVVELIRDDTGLNRVCLSGGTFNNIYLSRQLELLLTARSFEVFSQSEVPAGDGGLSLGQAMVAAHRVRRDAH
jgi:hydrogenase maturation protein HypF